MSKAPWQTSLANAVRDPNELFSLLNLDPARLDEAYQASKLFPLVVPRGFLSRMREGDVNDPLLKQVLPLGLELQNTPGFTKDPLKEQAANPVPGLLHKYHGRVLVTLTSACAINCRYCFRRHFPYEDNNPGRTGWEAIFDYIKRDANIHEVILSGGDPLVVTDRMLTRFTDGLQTTPHVKLLRIHSRLPIVLPERITDEFIAWATQLNMKLTMVIHANHPNEINEEVIEAIRKCRDAGMHVLNQTVLLRGVNDNAETLIALSHALYDAGVLPYYLHLLDKVEGVAHFDVPEGRANALHQAMRSRLPGYLVPRLVREIPGEPNKVPV